MELKRTRDERSERLDTGALHVFSLEEYTRGLREEPPYAENGRNGVTVVKSPGVSVVLKVLRVRRCARSSSTSTPASHGTPRTRRNRSSPACARGSASAAPARQA